jgi:ATP-dependent RNA helicase RhlE
VSFTSIQWDSRIDAGVQAQGYSVPTPIQERAIPPIVEGHDLMGLAQTGSGKTAAFVLPILQRLMNGPRYHVRALVLSPTRELAEQTHEVFTELGRKTGLKSVPIYGGVSIRNQIAQLKKGVDIAVACPGRLLDHLGQGTIDLSHLEVLVLDEADRMFDMGFLPDVRRIVRQLPGERQTLLFAATMPEDIRRLTREILRNPVTVQIGQAAPPETVSHALYPVDSHLKTPLLIELLRHTDTESVLVFTRTKHRAKRLGEQLQRAGFRASSLQGNLSQPRRQEAMEGFRKGSYQILVATDIASRGLDVSLISHVINYDIPDTTDAYIHRIGRTGRAEHTGDAFTFITREDREMVHAIERALGMTIDRRQLEGFDYAAKALARHDEFARPPLSPRRTSANRRPEPAGIYSGAGSAYRQTRDSAPAGRTDHHQAASPRDTRTVSSTRADDLRRFPSPDSFPSTPSHTPRPFAAYISRVNNSPRARLMSWAGRNRKEARTGEEN